MEVGRRRNFKPNKAGTFINNKFGAQTRVSLNTPDERCASDALVRFKCQVRWGSFFWPSPFWPVNDFFWFFWLNLGSTSPNYSRRPFMRSSKAPPIQKNRGQVLPHPSEPSLRASEAQRSLGVFRHFPQTPFPRGGTYT